MASSDNIIYVDTNNYIYELNVHRNKNQIGALFIKNTLNLLNSFIILIKDKNFVFVFNPLENQF